MGALVCYSVTDIESFQAVGKWINAVREISGPICSIVLVGLKSDVPHEKRQVTTSQGNQMAIEHGVTFFEVSSNNDTNVKETMDALAHLMNKEYDSIFVGSILGGISLRSKVLIDKGRTWREESDGAGFKL